MIFEIDLLRILGLSVNLLLHCTNATMVLLAKYWLRKTPDFCLGRRNGAEQVNWKTCPQECSRPDQNLNRGIMG